LARSWLWQKASFDATPFYVSSDEVRQSRRIVRHEYPGSEFHDLEDLGRNATSVELTAYFLSETADTDLAAFMARLAQPDAPGLLIAPMFSPIVCRAERWEPRWEKEALNYASCRVTFLEEGNAGAPIPVGLAIAQLAGMAGALAVVLGAAISRTLAGEPQTSYLRSDAADYVASLGNMVQSALQSVPVPATTADPVQVAIADAVRTVSGGPGVDPGAVATTILQQLNVIAATQAGNASTGAEGAAAIALSSSMAAALAIYDRGLVSWNIAEGATIVPLAATMAFAAAASQLIATAVYPDRQAAIAGRANIKDLASQIQAVYSAAGQDATNAFDQMIGAAAAVISRQIIDLAPYVIVETNASLPSNVLAWRLYADPSRASELDRLNRVGTPCFMPQQFVALSS
jgi:prophage DNA circulation protein